MLNDLVVIPAHYEQKCLGPSVSDSDADPNRISDNYSLVVAEDGPTYNTVAIARPLEQDLSARYLRPQRNQAG